MTRWVSFEEMMDVLGDIPIRFWVCPIEERSGRRDDNGGPVETVRWEGDVARCTASGCTHTSKEGTS